MPSTPTERPAELVLWHLTDSALPTGGFAHSAGMETYIQRGDIEGPEDYEHWLRGYLRQASYNEALAVRFAVELQLSGASFEERLARVMELDRVLNATQTPRELRASMKSMGKRWSRIGAIVTPDDELVVAYRDALNARTAYGNPGLAAGLVLGASGVDVRTAVTAYLMQMANSMTQNAIRAVPLGQDAGQRVLVSVYGTVLEAAELTLGHCEEDLGAAAPALEVAQMAHEELRSRMFMS